jgi:ribonuclease HI
VSEPRIDKSFPWSFFDNVCNDSLSGCSFIFHLTNHNHFHFMENVGRGTNNCNKIMALFLLLKLAHCHRIVSLHVFGDFSLVINCISGSAQIHNIVIRPLFDQLWDVSSLFTRIDFSHVFREMNQTTNKLSKYGLQLPKKHYLLQEFINE